MAPSSNADGHCGHLRVVCPISVRADTSGPFRSGSNASCSLTSRSGSVLGHSGPRWSFDALPSEKASVDRPPTRSQHRESATNGSHQKANHGLSASRQDLPDLSQGNQGSCHRRPQPRDQQHSRSRRDCGRHRRITRRVAPQPRARAHHQHRADDQAHQKQTCAGPTASECGIEASQERTLRSLGSVVAGTSRNPREGRHCDPFESPAWV